MNDNSPREKRKKGKEWKDELKPLSSKKLKKYDFVGFDVETYGDNNDFYMGGLYWYTKNNKPKFKAFYNKREMIDFLTTKKFQGKFIVATNLNFDLSVLLFDTPEWNDLEILKQQSNIIYAKYTPSKNIQKGTIRFIDTFNYLKTSVENLGEIIGKEKLEKPKALGKIPENENERKELEIYNKRDCEISCDFMYFLQKGINSAGGNIKITIASTSFDVWRRNFLPFDLKKEQQVIKDKEIRDFLFQGYYGGRTEVFKRGSFKNVYYYDINSLYPSVMVNKFPLPQSIKEINNPIKENIYNYEGTSEVDVYCPEEIRPLLPYKKDNKLIFPCGYFSGVYNHNELRKALKQGYKILNIKRQIIYLRTFKPFKNFVEHFYKERKKLKAEGNNLQITYKLILNSLYGKFGQKTVSGTKVLDPNNLQTNSYNETIDKIKEFVGNSEYVSDDEGRILVNFQQKYDGINCYPILASYVTSYARILMYDYLNHDEIIYTDTDSCICEKPLFNSSKELGKMDLEGEFKNCYVVKPKMYFLGNEEESDVKIKGISNPSEDDFNKILKGDTVKKLKFAKLNEAFRRGFNINQKIEVDKKLDLNDDKRIWKGKTSIPIKLNNLNRGDINAD